MRKYNKYTWVGNRIKAEDMAQLYYIKEKNKSPITELVAIAVAEYVQKYKI